MSGTQKLLTLLLTVVVAIFSAGCESNDTPINNGPVKIILENNRIAIDGNGGDINVPYFVENGCNGVCVDVECNDEWITDIKVYEKLISCHVVESDERELRTGRIKLTYPDSKVSATIYIEQDKMVLDIIGITVSNLTHNCCDITFTPKDNELMYVSNIISIDYFIASGITDEDIFLSEELGYMQSLAQNMDMTLEDYLIKARMLTSGEVSKNCSNFMAGGRYIVYAYGLDIDGDEYTISVPIHHIVLTMPMPELFPTSFEVSQSSSGDNVRLTITPETWDGYYTVQVVSPGSIYYVNEGEQMTPAIVKSLNAAFYNQARSAMAQGMDAEKYMHQNCYKGKAQINVAADSGKKYMLVVFAVKSDDGLIPVMCSEPQVFYYTK